jgi:signal-transduction protein with cAMP-binding, CBS, and nucleotidyltransferase domain
MCIDDMADQGFGEPPTNFDVIVMGSGGRGESYLNPDQDNGIIIADYPKSEHERIDAWFQELARRKTERLEIVGFDLCVGQVMSTNTRWRKTLTGFRDQTMGWISRARGDGLRYCDIFFDFRHCYGKGELTRSLRDFVTENAKRPHFLSQLYKLDEKHRGALNIFGHLVTDPNGGPNHGKIDLKSAGTLPLVQGIRLLALREGIDATSTSSRMSRLHGDGHLSNDEYDYLKGAHEHISNLLLRQQLEDHRQGNTISNHVSKQVLTKRQKDMLVDGYKALRAFHKRLGKLVSI